VFYLATNCRKCILFSLISEVVLCYYYSCAIMLLLLFDSAIMLLLLTVLLCYSLLSLLLGEQ